MSSGRRPAPYGDFLSSSRVYVADTCMSRCSSIATRLHVASVVAVAFASPFRYLGGVKATRLLPLGGCNRSDCIYRVNGQKELKYSIYTQTSRMVRLSLVNKPPIDLVLSVPHGTHVFGANPRSQAPRAFIREQFAFRTRATPGYEGGNKA